MSNRKPKGFAAGEIQAIFAGIQGQGGDDFLKAMSYRKQILGLDGFIYDSKSGTFRAIDTAPDGALEFFLQVKPADLPLLYRWAEWFVVHRNLTPGTLDALGLLAEKLGQKEEHEKLVAKVMEHILKEEEDEEDAEATETAEEA